MRFQVGDLIIYNDGFDTHEIIGVHTLKDIVTYDVKQGPNEFNYRLGEIYQTTTLNFYRLITEEDKAKFL